MKLATKTPGSLLSWLFVLLASLAISIVPASAGISSGSSDIPYSITEHEITTLLSHYSLEDERKVENISLKFYNSNDELVFSTEVCQQELDCDERINNFINQSDYITEVDNIKIYILNQ